VRGSQFDTGAPSAPYYASLEEQHQAFRDPEALVSWLASGDFHGRF
jgi:hypothetical protein